MDGEGLRAAVDRLCKPHEVLTEHDLVTVARIGQAVAAWMQRQADDLIADHDGMPVLVAYAVDGWSTNIRSDVVERATCGDKIRRTGNERVEFLLERAIIRAKPLDGTDQIRILFGEPRALKHGKGHGMY